MKDYEHATRLITMPKDDYEYSVIAKFAIDYLEKLLDSYKVEDKAKVNLAAEFVAKVLEYDPEGGGKNDTV